MRLELNGNWVIRRGVDVLFAVFAFLFLYRMQGDMLALTQHVFSHGVTHYSPLYGAFVILFLCFLMQWGVCRFVRFAPCYYALTFVPSALLLVFLTNLLLFSWTVMAGVAILLLLFIVLCVAVRRRRGGEYSDKTPVQDMTYNLLILTLVCVMTGGLSNTSDILHYELRMQRLLLNGQDLRVLDVAEKFLESSPRMTALRAAALNNNRMLGDKLFEYPLQRTSDALLIPAADSVKMLYNPLALTASIDTLPYTASTPVAAYLQQSLAGDTCRTDSVSVRDYWLCSLLMDKQLDRFAEVLPQYYECDMTQPDSLPKHYREALVLYTRLRFNPLIVWNEDAVMNANYEEFAKLQKENKNPLVRNNLSRRAFGNTYWWYYFYR